MTLANNDFATYRNSIKFSYLKLHTTFIVDVKKSPKLTF